MAFFRPNGLTSCIQRSKINQHAFSWQRILTIFVQRRRQLLGGPFFAWEEKVLWNCDKKKLCVWKACRRAFGSSIWFSLRSLWLTNSAVIWRRFFSKPSCIYVLKSKKMQYSTEDLTKVTKNCRAKSKSYRLFL